MESRGNRKYIDDTGKQIGVERVGSAIHFGPQWNRIKSLAYKVNNPNGYNDGFHKYEMLWDDQGIRFSVDDSEIGFVPVGDGIWRRGRFSGDDIWGNGTKMAPFDAEVSLQFQHSSNRFIISKRIFILVPFRIEFGCWRYEWVLSR